MCALGIIALIVVHKVSLCLSSCVAFLVLQMFVISDKFLAIDAPYDRQ